jgi:hypothetical protein
MLFWSVNARGAERQDASEYVEESKELHQLSEEERRAFFEEIQEKKNSSNSTTEEKGLDILLRTVSTLRWCQILSDGNVLIMQRNHSPNDGDFSLARNDATKILEVREYYTQKALYTIGPKGELLSTSETIGSQPPGTRYFGVDIEKNLKDKDSGAVVSRSKKRPRLKRKSVTPDEAIGWLYLTNNGELHAPPDDDIEPFENAIWVIRSGDSLMLQQQTADKPLLYAQVNPDFTITYGDKSEAKVGKCLWPFRDAEEKPACMRYPIFMSKKCYQEVVYLVTSDYIADLRPPDYAH